MEAVELSANTEPSTALVRDLRDLTLAEFEQVVSDDGERPFRARQIMEWLHRRDCESFDQMTNVPLALRSHLKRRFKIDSTTVTQLARSADGTRKLLLTLADGRQIETVLIPAKNRTTLCMSSQAGCAMGCEFCATARMGLHRNLTAAEIVAQIVVARRHLDRDEQLTNYVFMGMGEPLANYPRLSRALTIMTAQWGMAISPRRITVSTVGLAPMMEVLLKEFPVNLAVSIHAADDSIRDRIVPINRRYPLRDLLEACRRIPLKNRRRITFEYVLLRGINDSIDDARRLSELLHDVRAKVNLIFFNPFAGSGFASSSRRTAESFQAILAQHNLTATIRESRGADIAAACGQLYAERRAAPDCRVET